MNPSKIVTTLSAGLLAVVMVYIAAPALSKPAAKESDKSVNNPAMAVLEVRWWPHESDHLQHPNTIHKNPISLESLRYKIASSEAVGVTVDELGLTDFLPHRDDGSLYEEGLHVRQQFINLIAKGIKIELSRTGPYSALVYVKFTYSNRKQTPRIVNHLVESFISAHEKEATQERTRIAKLIRSKLDDYKKTLKDLDTKVLQLHLEYPGLDPAAPDSPENTAAWLAERIETTRRQRDLAVSVQERLVELHRGAVGLPPLEQPAVDDVSTRIAQLQGEADYAERELAKLRSQTATLNATRSETLTARQQLHALSSTAKQARVEMQSWQAMHKDITVRAAAEVHGIQYRILERAPEVSIP